MLSQTPKILLLVIVGVLLLTNPLWLFPNEGATKYTYERAEITVENGIFAYHGADIPDFAEENSLSRVGCQHVDDQARACAFDQHLGNHGPITVAWEGQGTTRPEFIRLADAYYRRIHRLNRSSETVAYDVERVSPRTVLAEAATNISGVSTSPSADLPLAFRIAVTGETVTSFEEPDRTELGRVYQLNGSYYTVVRTDESHIVHGPDVLRYETPRSILVIVGGLLLLGALALRTRDQS